MAVDVINISYIIHFIYTLAPRKTAAGLAIFLDLKLM